ncbi:hypothetical protein L917_05248 [Phytophthora nicotianae]|uniref:Uncharacterized protein n=1 Tax=Phytophthora nicotianae TaxID=4792 RepID=W2LJ68_PHYNI|nr:hypothetical protein L917_05248 [Phytophthora nicotianae]
MDQNSVCVNMNPPSTIEYDPRLFSGFDILLRLRGKL